MKPIHVPTLAAKALELDIPVSAPVTDANCAMCGTELAGRGVPFKPPQSFNNWIQLSDRTSSSLCISCSALQTRKALTGASASGVISHRNGFFRLYTAEERFEFLSNPPRPPFAVAIINAKQQHIWWHTPASYDQDHFLVRFGQRTLEVDRLAAFEAAEKIRAIEVTPGKYSRALYSFTQNLKASHDGHLKSAFIRDDSPEAASLKKVLVPLSFGTLWAVHQLLSALRKYNADTIEEAAHLARNARKAA